MSHLTLPKSDLFAWNRKTSQFVFFNSHHSKPAELHSKFHNGRDNAILVIVLGDEKNSNSLQSTSQTSLHSLPWNCRDYSSSNFILNSENSQQPISEAGKISETQMAVCELNQWPSTNLFLLKRIQNSPDSLSWSSFVDLYAPFLFSFCVKRGVTPTDAEDITQNVFQEVVRVIPAFQYDPRRGLFRSWLATITSRQLSQFFRC
jgi:hypothetical protein